MTTEELIASFERELFTGAFSESAIKADLENRRAMDNLSTMGSWGRQTNKLSEKRNFYIETFYEVLGHIDSILEHTKSDSSFIPRCEKCKNQANRLLDIVRNF